jgi:hypothetical protein
MSKKISNKINWQVIFNIIIVINFMISILAIFFIFKINDGVNFATWKDTHNATITQSQIECLKKPSAECEKEIERKKEDMERFIENYFKNK